MINIKVNGINDELINGVKAFTDKYCQALCGELDITVTYNKDNKLLIKRNKNSASISICKDVALFRCLAKIFMNFECEDYCLEETSYFDMIGSMFDMSQAAAFFKVEEIKRTLLAFAAGGLDTFMIYTEDCVDVKGEPYFGYMRPKYSSDELREIDDLAASLGIEVIPCIQTLSHLPGIMRWNYYRARVRDDDRTMLVGAEETYELIEKIIRSVMAPLRTKKVHLGLDEAWHLGQGEYLKKNGFVPQREIFAAHLARIKEIVDRLGYKGMIWNDMFFNAASKSRTYYIPIEEQVDRSIVDPPKGLEYVYWDYYHDYEYISATMKKHLEIFGDVIYAGVSRDTYGIGLMHTSNIQINDDALRVCKEQGVRKAFCCLWGDDNREAVPFAAYTGIMRYAEHGYNENICELELKKLFAFAIGDYDDFAAVSEIDIIKGYNDSDGNAENLSPSRHLLYQDPLLGMFDKNYEEYDVDTHFAEFARRMADAKLRGGAYADMFEVYASLGAFLEIKGSLGIKLRGAYLENDMAVLKQLCDEIIPKAIEHAKVYKSTYRNFFYKHYKPEGCEIFDIRMGGVVARLESTYARLHDYLSGNIPSLPELETERLVFNETPRMGSAVYGHIASATDISKL